ncbi:MAG: hypothetical protein H6712_32100 [Myxococcales bacterium]|nr:hypothetical protein [Myxococcales bacterium]MCB9718537.1 hypothetical protein [Myxococcales bacterium]
MACPGLAQAESSRARPQLEVGWTGPLECGPEPFTRSLEALLTESEVDARVWVEVVVEREDDGWRVDAGFHVEPDREGRRTFRAPACATVSQAAALAVAIAVDPTVLERVDPGDDAEPELATEAGVEPEPEPEPIPEPPGDADHERSHADTMMLDDPELGPIEPIARAEVEPPDDAASWRAVIGAGFRVDGVALPGPGLGGAARLGALHRRLRVDAEASYRAPTRRAAPEQPDAGGRFQQWTAGARACFVPRVGPVELLACGGLEGGRALVEGYGWPRSRLARRPWAAVTAGLGLAVPLGPRLALVSEGSVAIPLLRPEFAVLGVGSVYRVGPVQVRGSFGLELRLP